MESCIPIKVKMRCLELIEQGHSVTEVGRLFGYSRQVIHKWLARTRTYSLDGLADRSRRPLVSPERLATATVQAIVQLRRRERLGPARIALRLKVSQASVYRTLCRHGLQYLRPKRPRVVHRYEKAYPGELLHMDTKTLVPLRRGTPPEHQFAILDDFSREAFSRIYPTATTQAATDFLLTTLKALPYSCAAILTDNALCFTMRHAYHAKRTTLFASTCVQLGIRHQLIRPYHPETNGKVERFFRTVNEECYERIHLRSSPHRARVLQDFLSFYNHERPHLSLGGLTPVARRDRYLQLSTMS